MILSFPLVQWEGVRSLDAKLTKSLGPGIKPLAVEVKDIAAETGTLTLTLFDTDQAGFKVAHQP